ncbi:DUF300-domain-containing protein [Dentipellis sp. KUC8613]|nr:DUF300-domain-containing protein [Dentipellis sp. KUC8613]
MSADAGNAPDAGSGGAGSALHPAILIVAGIATLVATLVSAMSIYLHLKNYRKPMLQRMVIRIMLMVPIYAISSLISLLSLQAAFVIDVIRDIYEAFVIYCFFQLLLGYLGGERSLLILVHGRPPKIPPFPMNIFQREMDISDPYTFLFLKRGILQYVQVKPILAVATLILKAAGKYNEGSFRANSGYLYVSIIYNTSICLSLYCLAMFWLCINDDLKPFRPMPKFLCVKGILFFSFWQSIGISILVAAGAISRLGPYTDSEHISLGLTDTLICLEMPIFAIAHMYAFSHKDYKDPYVSFVGRMPVFYAARDAFGLKDVVEDSKATLRGEGMDYREFEPSEGYIHQGLGRERRIRAGLRYSKGGKGKYWLPQPSGGMSPSGRIERGVNSAIGHLAGRDQEEDVHAPLLEDEADDVLHDEDEPRRHAEAHITTAGYELPFDVEDDEGDEDLYQESKQYLFGDYNYPCIDASTEAARLQMWDEEERILRDERSAWFSGYHYGGPASVPNGLVSGKKGAPAYGATGSSRRGMARIGSNGSTGYPGSPSQERKSTPPHHVERSYIDYEADRIPEDDPSDVKLKWTKFTKRPSRSGSAPASPHHLKAPELASRHSFSHSPSSAGSSPGARSRALARARHTPPGESPRPDAVDLVVEDGHAAEAEMSHERRHGEPAVRGAGLRKVYRRRYVGDDDAAEEIEEEGEERVRVGSREDLGRVTQAVAEAEEDELERAPMEGMQVEDMTIARAQTPPAHARVEGVVDRYEIPERDANPWA